MIDTSPRLRDRMLDALPLLADGDRVAAHAGVRRNTLYAWQRRNLVPASNTTYGGWPIRRVPFPTPVASFGGVPVWWLPDIDEWLELTGRTP